MGSFERQLKRNQAKRAYTEFSKSWNLEKARQEAILADGGELPEGQHLLRHKPSFNTFSKFFEKAPRIELKQDVQPTAEPPKEEEKIDKEWNEQ